MLGQFRAERAEEVGNAGRGAAAAAPSRSRGSQAKTFRIYVVSLLRRSLNGYAYRSLDGFEEKRYRKAFDAGDEEAFTRPFGPEKITENLGEFLGRFMCAKRVIAGEGQLLRASGT